MNHERTYADPDSVSRALHLVDAQLYLLGTPTREWSVGAVPFEAVGMWWGKLAGPSASLGAARAGTSVLLMVGEGAGWTVNGQPVERDDVALLPELAAYACSFPTPADWFALELPHGALGRAHAGLPLEIEQGRGARPLNLRNDAARVRRCFRVARDFSVRHANLAAHPRTRALLERTLLDAVLGALPSERVPASRDPRLLPQLLSYLREHPDDSVWQEDICRALRTTRRSLNRLFPQAFGTTPGRYLRLRRLHLARRALASGALASVTAAAVHYGFFDLGRFASAYRGLFGEMPSATLASTVAPSQG